MAPPRQVRTSQIKRSDEGMIHEGRPDMPTEMTRAVRFLMVSCLVVACGGKAASESASATGAAGASATGTPSAASQPFDTLRVERVTSIPGNATPFTGASQDAHGVQAFYDRLMLLPPPPDGIWHCGLDLGVRYRLAFRRANEATVTTLSIDAAGCRMVYDANEQGFARGVSEAIYRELASLLGVQEADIYPVPLPR